MTLDEIRQLIEVLKEAGVAEIEVQRGDNRVRVRAMEKTADFGLPPGYVTTAGYQPAAVAPVATPAATLAARKAEPLPEGEPDNALVVTSPIVGTFYGSPSPESPAFVNVGDSVAKGQVLCIIESMKLMNEIESDYAGMIVSKLVENGKPVEYGQALFKIKPA